MAERIRDAGPPTGMLRLAFRAPVHLYRWRLGWLLGSRFLLLTHTGRVSGQARQTALEVVDHDPARGAYMVASGFGKKSQWYRNLASQPRCTIQVGRKVMPATAVLLPAEESGEAMVAYAQRHPRAARKLMRLCGFEVDGGREDYLVMGREHIPFVRFEPHRPQA